MTLIEIKEGKIIREVPHFGFDPHGELRITKSFTEQVKLINIRLVETQRLLTINESEQNIYQATVTKYANELAEKIKSIMAQSMELAAHLDRSYPSRLAKNRKKYQNTSAAQLTNELNKLEEKRQLLHSVGLIDKEEDSGFLYSDSVDEFMIPVLMVYIDDSKQKLQIFDKLARKMKLFIEIINNRFLYKKISMDKERGFIFTSSITGKTIPATGLSSGEQHEFVLFFELLFKVQPHSLILIDEPEISLHLSWLKYFIEDLKEVIKLNEMELLIATHSPDIISNHWDLTVELEGLEEKQVEI
jgi:predicted ATP-binding protein involved in virulence